jgi:hypothetical protein
VAKLAACHDDAATPMRDPGRWQARRVVLELEVDMCQHQPRCADASAPDHGTARVVASHYEQGWSLLCNGVVLFDDGGELLPGGRAVAPPRRATTDDRKVA